MMGLVDDEEVDSGLGGLLAEPPPGGEQIEPDHGAPVDVERVEVGPMIAGHVGQPLFVEEGEGLVVLAPELAEPLQGQGLGRDN